MIVGAGQAAAAAIRALRANGFNGSIDLVGAEPHLPYERPPLSKELLLGKAEASSSIRLSGSDATQHGVNLHLGLSATSIDPSRRQITLENGRVLTYDALLIATGESLGASTSPARIWPACIICGHRGFPRDGAVLDGAQHIAVVGGGFIGLELASAAIARGVAVTLLEREPEIMARIMPAAIGGAFRNLARRYGVDVRRNAAVTAITKRGTRLGVVTGDGVVEVDAVLVGIGMQPMTAMALQAGCATTAGGIDVDAEGRTSVPGIWAAGDCALHHEEISGRRISLESWHNAEEQGAAAGRSMAGHKAPAASKRPWFWTDQFDCNIQMLGVTSPQDGVAFTGPTQDAPGAVYRTFDRTNGRLTSVVAFSDPHAIRSAQDELDAATLFDPAVHGTLLLDERENADTTTESGLMNANPSLSLAKRYIWPAEGLTRIPDWVYTNQSIYEREIEKIFHGRTWNYVALEAEVPNSGDYIRSNVGPTPVVVARGEDSRSMFSKTAAHRHIHCRELSGNAKEFVCPYHQWSYDLKGNLAGVPFPPGA